MIEPMKKITLLLHSSDKKKSLAKLQSLGLLHLEMNESITGDKYRKIQKKIQSYETILNKINKLHHIHASHHESTNSKSNELISEESSKFPEGTNTFHQKMLHLEKRFEKLEKEYLAREELIKNRKSLEPWGEFDWNQLEGLDSSGINYEFYITTESNFAFHPKDEEFLFLVGRTKDLVHLLRLIPPGYQDLSPLSYERIDLPRISIREIDFNLQIINRSILKDEIFLSQFALEADNISTMIQDLDSLSDFEKAKNSLTNDEFGIVFSITGYLPRRREPEILRFLNQEGISYSIVEPTEKDDVPIQLRNNRFSKTFEPITKIFALPKYMELDPTALFAPFFALFFGLCLGDIGYGAILLLVSTIAYFRVNKDSRIIPLLLIFLSLSTIISGVFLNTFFGEAFFKIPESDFYILETGRNLAIFSAYTVDGRTVYPAMTLALVLGFIQLSFGIILQSINRFLMNRNFLYSIHPLSVLLLLWGGGIIAVHRDFLGLGFNSNFIVGIFPIGAWVSILPETFGMYLFYTGVLGFFLFNNPEKNLIIRPVFGVWEAYQFLIGFAGDFLSYVRLFALGLASGLLGNAFNQVAFMILPDQDISSPIFALTIVILIIGHVLNLALSVLGSFVHPLRLTFVEFYKNMNFVGGGREFKAFAKSKDMEWNQL